MLAGVLLRFGLDVFARPETEPLLVLAMFPPTWRPPPLPRYAVVTALRVAGAVSAGSQGSSGSTGWRWRWRGRSSRPELHGRALIGVAIPLFVVTMASQNVTGVAVMRASGYSTPVSPLVGWTGAATVALAPFGGYALNLAAITAAICMGREAHDDPARRYVAAVAAGAFYLVVGLFGATVVGLFAAFPRSWCWPWPGWRCSAPSAAAWWRRCATTGARAGPRHLPGHRLRRLTLLGVGSAFWGLVAGVVALLVTKRR